MGAWLRWTAWVTVGELVGLSASLGAMALAIVAIGEPDGLVDMGVVLTVAAAGGVVEGSILGAAQHRVLRERLPDLPLLPWIAVTAGVASLCWIAGMLPSLLMAGGEAAPDATVAEPPLAMVLLLAAATGGTLGAVLAGGQAAVLSRYARGIGAWVLAHVVAWAAGMTLVFAVLGLPASDAPAWMWTVAAAAAAGSAGLVVGAISGACLPWVVPRVAPEAG